MNKNVKKILSFLTSGLVIVLFVAPVLLQGADGTIPGRNPDGTIPGRPNSEPITIGNPFKCTAGTEECTLPGLIRAIVNKILLPIGGLVAAVVGH